jgi:hypothetical protein
MKTSGKIPEVFLESRWVALLPSAPRVGHVFRASKFEYRHANYLKGLVINQTSGKIGLCPKRNFMVVLKPAAPSLFA